ncbi:MAG: transcription-repair coupling factor [Treponema sp.]|nr:transcription-repair coupling factor [Treponema sp.]
MNTLSANAIRSHIKTVDSIYSDIVHLAAHGHVQVERTGVPGAFLGCWIALFCAERITCIEQASDRAPRRESPFSAPAGDVLVIVPGEQEALALARDISFFSAETAVHTVPSWGVLPYRPVPQGNAVFGSRAALLATLALRKNHAGVHGNTPVVCIVPERVFLSPVPPPEYSAARAFCLTVGTAADGISLAEQLVQYGYRRVPRVTVHGEFSRRGEVLDVFPPEAPAAIRIRFDFDTVADIHYFDPELQLTTHPVERVIISPLKEISWDEPLVQRLSAALAAYRATALSVETVPADGQSVHLPFTAAAEQKAASLLEQLALNGAGEGEELWYPLLWEKSYSLLDYFSAETTVLCSEYARLKNGADVLLREYRNRYRQVRAEFPVLPPDMLLLPFEETLSRAVRCVRFNTLSHHRPPVDSCEESYSERLRRNEERYPTAIPYDAERYPEHSAPEFVHPPETLTATARGTDQSSIGTPSKMYDDEYKNRQMLKKRSYQMHEYIRYPVEPSRSFFGNIAFLKDELTQFRAAGWSVFVCADGEHQARRLETVLKEFCQSSELSGALTVVPQAVSAGFSVPDSKLLVIQEDEIFGRRRSPARSLAAVKSRSIDSFLELAPGDFVVHVNYGIGLFLGIERVRTRGLERDYIKLEYADQEFAFVPIEQMNLVQRYSSGDGAVPKIDHIGSKAWENRKSRVKKAVEELAERLIDLYSRRKASPGIPFPKDTEWQFAFEAAFPYEDTPDQATVTEEVKRDMEQPIPMDRLICGDVGYGKTEIALRAAFKAIMGGRQVAFLVPTTILAEQHYETCLERFKHFPVRVAQLSRFVTRAAEQRILAELATGKIDIIVGTHRIIQKDVQFKNLGLMIIDEEQRFGVKDKERLKELRTNIDALALSATPIPRTLHMSLLKIRDMSVLATPPQNRQAIETDIAPYDDEKVAFAIRREVERGGQVFFLHNRVETLVETKLHLERLVPEMLIDVASGQMRGEELDDIFHRFKLGGFHVLVATTIIENGIDIPNVNTIIIDRADMYGVSQLYQLRGRVGRGDRQAYAYLLYPEHAALSEVAMKRLQVISDFTELGSGFKIALKDMEIRGAGNLLGRDQSGDVYAVGFDLYLKLLNEAVDRLMSSGTYREEQEVLLELEYTGFIPADYIESTETKMEVYKKIAAVETGDELTATRLELTDRFGPIPDEMLSLISLAEIRILCRTLGISSFTEHNGVITIVFAQVSAVSVDKVMRLIQNSAGSVRLRPENPNMLFLHIGKIGLKEKSTFIKEQLETLV